MPNTITQSGIGLTAGKTYKLVFSSDITSGVLQVYQGTQKIYDTSSLPVWGGSDIIQVTERVTIDRSNTTHLLDTVSLSENISLRIFYPIDIFDSITISESKTLTII